HSPPHHPEPRHCITNRARLSHLHGHRSAHQPSHTGPAPHPLLPALLGSSGAIIAAEEDKRGEAAG
ncbi:unnamed protein product, partial [Closterium sp. NIES-53]